MKITKYEHACFTVEKDGTFLVIDPGNLTTDFISPENVAAVIITHKHADHFDHDHLAAIIDKNPDAIIIGPQEVVSQIEVFETKAVAAGDSVSIGGFDLTFYGKDHAVIHSSLPHTDNIGVFIDELLFFPGDALTVPDVPVTVLAIPATAPWMKIGDAMDYLQAVSPRQAFPVHEQIYSPKGLGIVHRLLGTVAEQTQTDYHVLEPGESLQV